MTPDDPPRYVYRLATAAEGNDPNRPGYVDPETMAWVDEIEDQPGARWPLEDDEDE